MRKLCCLILTGMIFQISIGQKSISKNELLNKPADHLMIQLGGSFWNGTADSVQNYVKGFSRSANVYAMLNRPFKNNPKLSLGIGIGIGNNNIFFDKMEVKIASNRPLVPFIRNDTGNNFKKYKLSTTFLEIPLELRFSSKPETPNKSLKFALGVKVGTLLNVHTKGKNLENSTGGKLNSATVKENSKTYFNTTRVAGTVRLGYGIFGVFGAYTLTNLFKDGVAPNTKPYQIGITISGL